MNKTIIGYKIELDDDKDTVTLKETGKKMPLYRAFQITRSSTSEALRMWAYTLLNRANFIEHDKSHFGEKERLEQINKMIHENTLSIFG